MRRCNSIFISDVHLGTKHCQAELLLNFLESHQPEKLYLLGDIVDFWALKRKAHWPPSHTHFLHHIRRMSESGCDVIYVPGNHDGVIRSYLGIALPNLNFHMEYTHVSPTGRCYRLLHGDRFDGAMATSRWLTWIGDEGLPVPTVQVKQVQMVGLKSV